MQKLPSYVPYAEKDFIQNGINCGPEERCHLSYPIKRFLNVLSAEQRIDASGTRIDFYEKVIKNPTNNYFCDWFGFCYL